MTAFVFGLLLAEQVDVKPLMQADDQVQRVILFALVPVVVAFSFFVFVFYRSKREATFRQRETALKLNIAQGELKALRAQMNPHFIFNCMNSIHHYMHANQTQAGDYLIKFSQLIRHVLESSAQRMVTLADEIEANKNYLYLEQLRMNHSFVFSMSAQDGLDTSAICIPPMIIQPFIENSIWHGLSQKGNDGKIEILFAKKDDQHIYCIIKDNGIESNSKSEIDLSHVVKKTSMGLKLIEERLTNLNTLYGTKASFEITTNTNEGKSIVVTIPFED